MKGGTHQGSSKSRPGPAFSVAAKMRLRASEDTRVGQRMVSGVRILGAPRQPGGSLGDPIRGRPFSRLLMAPSVAMFDLLGQTRPPSHPQARSLIDEDSHPVLRRRTVVQFLRLSWWHMLTSEAAVGCV